MKVSYISKIVLFYFGIRKLVYAFARWIADRFQQSKCTFSAIFFVRNFFHPHSIRSFRAFVRKSAERKRARTAMSQAFSNCVARINLRIRTRVIIASFGHFVMNIQPLVNIHLPATRSDVTLKFPTEHTHTFEWQCDDGRRKNKSAHASICYTFIFVCYNIVVAEVPRFGIGIFFARGFAWESRIGTIYQVRWCRFPD